MKKKTIHTGGHKTPGLPFQGEMMTCFGCKKQQRSRPDVESNWTSLSFDEKRFYFCPACFAKLLRDKNALPF